MLGKWMDTLFAPKTLRQYTGRHRAPRTPDTPTTRHRPTT
jgi:hypothetical protein